LIFCHANGGSFAKILCLPINSWSPTDDRTPPMISRWTSLLPKLQPFAPQCTEIANQMKICFATRPSCIFLCSNRFFNILVPLGCCFLPATLNRFCPQYSTAETMIADLSRSPQFHMEVAKIFCHIGCKLLSHFFVLQCLLFNPVCRS